MNTPNQPDTPSTEVPSTLRMALAVDSHGWEDFPSHRTGDQAAELLACWTALWHPGLLQATGQIPQWQRIDQLPEDSRGWIVLVPTFSRDLLPDGAENRFADMGGSIVFGLTNRNELVQKIFEHIDASPSLNESSVADFFSLGYCYLQIQLMTRQLRYSSSLDEELFQQSVKQAATAASGVPGTDFESAIQKCFDQLCEERNRYYPTTANLIDYVLLTKKTLGSPLVDTLTSSPALSLQASGETIDEILENPDLTNRIRQKHDCGQLTIAGGEYYELPCVLLSTWSCARQLELGVRRIDELVGRSSRIFGRRRFGLHVGLPGLLEQFEIESVVHNTLDDGVFPQTSANHIRWEGEDGTTVDALVSPPKLASDPETWLNLGVRIGEMIDINQYASLFFARWPGQGCEYYFDLVNSCRFGSVLGNLVTLAEYFENVADPGYTQSYAADDYRDPYLKQMVAAGEPDPLSRFVDYWNSLVATMMAGGMMAMSAARNCPGDTDRLLTTLDSIASSLLARGTGTDPLTEPEPIPDAALLLEETVANFGTPVADADVTTIFNPLSFKRRRYVPLEHLDPGHPTVLFADETGAIVELPSMGFTQLKSGGHTTSPVHSRKKTPALAEDVFLRNEFFEVEVDEQTGGIGAIKFHRRRTNLIAQQLAFRQTESRQSRSGQRNAVYSKMVADQMVVTDNSAVRGQITSEGSLKIGDAEVARFRQTTTVNRGIPVVDVQIEIHPARNPVGDPWHNYYACRFAWDDEVAALYAYQNESRQHVVRPRIVSPMALEIDQHDFKTTILSGGLPFHQRIAGRRLDSLLSVQGETRTRFHVGIGINLQYPYQSALNLLASDVRVSGKGPAINPDHAWLFHLNCKNVVALYWIPTEDRAGVRLLLKETEGRRVELTVRCCREITSAQVQKISGRVDRELSPEGDYVSVSVCAHEMLELTIFW